MTVARPNTLATALRDIPDFPKPGIVFKDITPILSDPALFRLAIEQFADSCRVLNPTKIVGIEARGFIFGGAVAHALGLGFVPVRKKGKLPYKTRSIAYSLEYGEAILEIHEDAIAPGERVVIIDDVLATGGTARAASELITQAGGAVIEAQFLVELAFLQGRAALNGVPARAFVVF